MKPIQRIIEADIDIVKTVEGLHLISDDEAEQIKLSEALGSEFTEPKDVIERLRK